MFSIYPSRLSHEYAIRQHNVEHFGSKIELFDSGYAWKKDVQNGPFVVIASADYYDWNNWS